jgi:small subunit ribosomal protein S7
MSRRHSAETRKVLPDAKYNNVTVGKMINYLMVSGKKSVAESIVYNSFDIVAKNLKSDPVQAFLDALENVRPTIEVRSRRVGGATYQVPVDVRQNRSISLALKWLINSSRSRREKTMEQRLASELMDALNRKGASIKKREDTHKMADANKAFAHFRW